MEFNLILLIKTCRKFVVLAFLINTPIVLAQDNSSNWKLELNLALEGELSQFSAQTSDLQATYYFEPLGHASGTYAERDFLNQTNSFGLRTLLEDSKGGRESYSGYHLGIESSIVKGANVYEPKARYTDYADLKTIGIGIGYAFLLTDFSRLIAGIDVNREEIASGNVLASRLNVGYKKLWRYKRARALATEFNLEFTKSENESRNYSVAKISSDLDYYFTNRWGVGLKLSHAEAQIKRFEYVGLSVSANYFYSPNLGVDLVIGVGQNGESTVNAEGALSLLIRF